MVRFLICHAEEEEEAAQKALIALYAESKPESNIQQQLTTHFFGCAGTISVHYLKVSF